MIIYHSRFLTRGEVWFDNEVTSEPVDWIIFRQRSRPAAKGKWRPFYTRVIDLTQPAEALMAQMDGFTAAFRSHGESIWRNVWVPPSGGMTSVGLVHPPIPTNAEGL